MKCLSTVFAFLLIEISVSYSQVNFPQEKINSFLDDLSKSKTATPSCNSQTEKLQGSPSHFFQQFPYGKSINILFPKSDVRDYDTLLIGAVPNDSLTISGTWFHDGPVFVFNDGVLIFKNAQATINGDLYVINHGKVFSDNSSIYFPQQYFYQRGLVAANDAQVEITSSSLDYSALSHSMAIVDSALVQYQNVSVNGFTTTGLYSHGSFVVDTCDLVGEIICMDETNLQVSNGETVLVWHQFPDGSVIHRSFPDGSSGISGAAGTDAWRHRPHGFSLVAQERPV